MSFDVSGLTDYVDQTSTELIVKAVTCSSTASIVSKQAGIKSKAAINIFDTSVTFQDGASCGFNASDTSTFTQREIEVNAVKIQESLCLRDLQPKWTQLLLSAGQDYDESDLPMAYMDRKMALIAQEIEIADWQAEDGVGAANLAFYDGFLATIDNSGVAIDGNTGAVTVATGITEANVIDILRAMWKELPESELSKADKTFFLGEDIYRLYQCALINANLYHHSIEDKNVLFGTDVALFPTCGLNGTDRIILASAANLVIGYDMEGDEDFVKVWYENKEDLVCTSVRFMRGTQVAFPDCVVEFTLVP